MNKLLHRGHTRRAEQYFQDVIAPTIPPKKERRHEEGWPFFDRYNHIIDKRILDDSTVIISTLGIVGAVIGIVLLVGGI